MISDLSHCSKLEQNGLGAGREGSAARGGERGACACIVERLPASQDLGVIGWCRGGRPLLDAAVDAGAHAAQGPHRGHLHPSRRHPARRRQRGRRLQRLAARRAHPQAAQRGKAGRTRCRLRAGARSPGMRSAWTRTLAGCSHPQARRSSCAGPAWRMWISPRTDRSGGRGRPRGVDQRHLTPPGAQTTGYFRVRGAALSPVRAMSVSATGSASPSAWRVLEAVVPRLPVRTCLPAQERLDRGEVEAELLGVGHGVGPVPGRTV